MLTAGRRLNRLIGAVVLAILAALLIGCTPSHAQSTFDTLGPVSRSQAQLFYIIFWAGMFVMVIVVGALLYAAIRYRRRPGQGDPEQIHGHTRLEIAWTIAPVLILAVVVVPTVRTIFDNMNSPTPPEEGGLVVDAIGHQWWFEFRYAHPVNANEEIVFANELHIPVGEPVNIRLDSVDVIHSFWVPKLAGKVDMVPNNDNTMWFQADQPGKFLGQCAEFCGIAHAHMKFTVIAQPRAEFDAWLLAQAAPAIEPADPLAQEGQAVFKKAGCNGCHATSAIMKRAADGSRIKARTGPNLTHVAARSTLAAGVLNNADETGRVNDSFLQSNLREWLEDPEELKPGNIMARDATVFNDPERALTEPEVSALIAYLSSLK